MAKFCAVRGSRLGLRGSGSLIPAYGRFLKG